MATPWCRLWADMPNDPKWRTIAKASKRNISEVIAVYVHMMTNATNANERGRTQGWCDEDVANALDLETENVAAIREAMQGRVLEDDYLSGWSKRQPNREDGAAERAKAWRDKQKNDNSEGEGKNERKRTQTNAEERPDTDTDTDKKNRAKRFAPPPLDEVAAYCIERGKGVNPDKWYNHYSAKNWMIGKNKMVDWKAAVRTWEPDEKPVEVRQRRFEL